MVTWAGEGFVDGVGVCRAVACCWWWEVDEESWVGCGIGAIFGGPCVRRWNMSFCHEDRLGWAGWPCLQKLIRMVLGTGKLRGSAVDGVVGVDAVRDEGVEWVAREMPRAGRRRNIGLPRGVRWGSVAIKDWEVLVVVVV